MTNTPYANIDEFYRRGLFAPYVRERRMAGSAPVHLLKIGQPPGAFPEPPLDDVRVMVATGASFRSEVDLGAGRWRGRYIARDLCVVPASVATNYVQDDAHAFLVLALPVRALIEVVQEASPGFGGDFGRLHAGRFRDDVLASLCLRLWTESRDMGLISKLFADGAVLALGAALLRLAQGGQPSGQAAAGLSPRQLRRAIDFVQGNLGHDIGLPELAAAAGLAPSYFARGFRRSLGLPPYQYLVQQRVERARELLAGSELSIVEIALACGFANQTHMGKAMKRVTGFTPATFRADQHSSLDRLPKPRLDGGEGDDES